MTSPPSFHSDQDVKNAAYQLFKGCAPERVHDIDQLWARLQPMFKLTPDTLNGERFILDAGAYVQIRFNYRVMRAFWLAAYVAWEGYTAVQAQTAKDEDIAGANLDRFKVLIKAFEDTLTSDTPHLEPLPDGVPEPGVYPSSSQPQQLTPAELATIAAGWALLHEARHLQHQQESTAIPYDASASEKHGEEMSCDEFATSFLLERVNEYATQQSVDASQVARKRRAGIYFALFAMTLVTKDHLQASESHPAVAERIQKTMGLFGERDADCADAVAYAAFCALRVLWPEAPVPAFPHRILAARQD